MTRVLNKILCLLQNMLGGQIEGCLEDGTRVTGIVKVTAGERGITKEILWCAWGSTVPLGTQPEDGAVAPCPDPQYTLGEACCAATTVVDDITYPPQLWWPRYDLSIAPPANILIGYVNAAGDVAPSITLSDNPEEDCC